MNNSIFARKAWNKPNSNRYAKIHALFTALAVIKGVKPNETTEGSRKVKQFWKDFFGIKTLKELSDERLHEIEDFIEKRLEFEHARKSNLKRDKTNKS